MCPDALYEPTTTESRSSDLVYNMEEVDSASLFYETLIASRIWVVDEEPMIVHVPLINSPFDEVVRMPSKTIRASLPDKAMLFLSLR